MNDQGASMQTQIGNRLREARKTLGFTQREMDALLKIGKRSWQRYETGNTEPSGSVLQSLTALGVNINWILTGDAEMFRDPALVKNKEFAVAMRQYKEAQDMARQFVRDLPNPPTSQLIEAQPDYKPLWITITGCLLSFICGYIAGWL